MVGQGPSVLAAPAAHSALPEREIVVEGRPAIVVTYQSVRDDAVLEVLFDQDTYRIDGAHTHNGSASGGRVTQQREPTRN